MAKRAAVRQDRQDRQDHPVLKLIDQHSDKIDQTLRSYISNKEINVVANADALLNAMTQLLELATDNFSYLVDSFVNLVHATHPGQDTVSAAEFKSLLKAWVVANNVQPLKLKQIQDMFLKQLDKSIKQYSTLARQTRDQEELNSIHELLGILKSKRAEVVKVSRPANVNFTFRKDPTPEELKGVQEIFKFYTKQHVMTGKAPTFDYIGEVVGVIDVGSFVFFAKSFGIISEKRAEGKRFLTKKEVVDIFKKCATLQKSMNFEGFRNALDEVAQQYFNEEYDRIASIPCAHIGLEEKRVMLYELLRCGDHRFLHHALRPIGGGFFNSVDRAARIQPEDPAKHFKFKVTEQVKEQIKGYKQEKEAKLRQEREVKAKESYEKTRVAQKKLRERREQEELKKRKDVIRIQDLDKINYKDLGENENLEDLIM